MGLCDCAAEATFVQALQSVATARLKRKEHPQTFEAAVEALQARYAEHDWPVVSIYKWSKIAIALKEARAAVRLGSSLRGLVCTS